MKRSWYAAPYGLWMAMSTILPLLFVAYFAFRGPDGAPTLEHLGKFAAPTYLNILWHSMYLAFLCTAICLLIGYPAAHFLASKDFQNNKALFVLILLPMWMNFLLRTYAMMSLIEDSGVINTFLKNMGFGPLYIIGTEGAVLLGMVYNFVPFMILPIHTSLKKMDARIIEAAEDLGANPAAVFAKVVFPLSVPGIVSGITMVFMPAVTTFAISRLLGSGMFMLFGDVIEKWFMEYKDWGFGSMLSLVMMLLIIASMGLLNKADPKKEGSGAW